MIRKPFVKRPFEKRLEADSIRFSRDGERPRKEAVELVELVYHSKAPTAECERSLDCDNWARSEDRQKSLDLAHRTGRMGW